MLDRSSKIPELRPSIMSIGRKWVSDTNLSKLLHETIEKKQANKQRKLPDFCKDAILGATIKKISSAMLIDGKLPDDSESCSKSSSDDGMDSLCGVDISDKSWEDDSEIAMNLGRADFEDMDDVLTMSISKSDPKWRTARPPLERQSACNSPKRKRQPSNEGADDGCSFADLHAVAPVLSPRKKRRAEFLKGKSNRSPTNCTIDDDNLLSDSDKINSNKHDTHQRRMDGQRSRSLPHLMFLSSDDLIIPPKNTPTSVVNSISELSIHDCLKPSGDSSWCFANNEPADSDPLELNRFFQELSTVTVHPN